ncbi:pentatricopeptide repeat-containing protein At5g16860 [Apium graveolens]|uniref:pentatricopeptide repeat-containing protein At5g16860 n=1 Tax=Apium graveolens TaxID=4045 RepID=UPI003D7AD4D2
MFSMPKHTQLKTLTKTTFLSFSTSTLTTTKSSLTAKLTHQQHIVRGLANSDPITIISIYTHSNSRDYAIKVLERVTPSSSAVYWWNELIKIRLPFMPNESIEMFVRMLRLGWEPDGYTFPFVLKACGEVRGNGLVGFCVHAVVVKKGFVECNVFVCNALVMMYFKSGVLRDARKVFDEMCERGVEDVVSWNSIVAAYVQSGDVKGALRLFQRMGRRGEFGVRADAISLVNVLPACGVGKAWRRGKEVHGYAVRSGLSEDVFVGNAIVDMYAKCELMDEASKVFERMKVKDVVSWNAMVTGYSQVGRFEDALSLFERMKMEKIDLNVVTWSAVIGAYAQRGLGYEALDVFRQMQLSGSEPNIITLLSLLSGCASVGALLQGKETHCYAMKEVLNVSTNDPGDNMMVINGIIDMYAKCKSANIARAIFDSIDLEDRNVVTWTVMIGGYAQHGEANDALQLFGEMLAQNKYVMPNAFTISCALMACARLAALRFGRQIHAYVIRNHFESSTFFVANCLIDMYVKSGDVDTARVIFDNMDNKNSVSWTSLMTGYGMHGRGEEAIRVFDRMRRAGMPIDGVTFVVVLYACSHSGMVDQGMEYFNRMEREYSVIPGVEHYACMVDLLGRAGRLNESVNFIKEMPMDPSPIVWVALLSACRLHTNVELGEFAAAELLKLEAENDGSYTLLSNIYANARRWKDVARIRSLMKYSGIRKRPGCSWVQGKKGTATFFVGDKTHPRSQEIYDLLADLIHRITALGYVPDTRFALHDVDDEEKGGLLFEHSEKLALAYGILTSPPGMPIRITKNLRVCGDCHTAIAYISKIIDHEVIIRDSSRFHQFKNGSCSCKGFW